MAVTARFHVVGGKANFLWYRKSRVLWLLISKFELADFFVKCMLLHFSVKQSADMGGQESYAHSFLTIGWSIIYICFPPLCGVILDRVEQVGLRVLPRGPTVTARQQPTSFWSATQHLNQWATTTSPFFLNHQKSQKKYHPKKTCALTNTLFTKQQYPASLMCQFLSVHIGKHPPQTEQ